MESASRADRIGLAIRRPADARPLRPRVCRACMACRLWRRAAERMGGVPARAKRSARGATVHHIRVVPPQCGHVPLLRGKRPKYTQPGRRQARMQASCVGDLHRLCPPGRAKTHLTCHSWSQGVNRLSQPVQHIRSHGLLNKGHHPHTFLVTPTTLEVWVAYDTPARSL